MLALKVCGGLAVLTLVVGLFESLWWIGCLLERNGNIHWNIGASVQVLWISNPPTFINYEDRVVVEKLSNGRMDRASPLVILVSAILAVLLARS